MRDKLLYAALCCAMPLLPMLSGAALAEQAPRALAMESYRFMDAAQPKLTELIKSRNKTDYFAQFSSPAKAIVEKWPKPITEDYYDYADCYFALDLLVKFADAAMIGDVQKNAAVATRKAKFANAFRECQRDLRKM